MQGFTAIAAPGAVRWSNINVFPRSEFNKQ